ncbi:hypothetical protein GCM10023081_23160 [Arthrobacter ginkgonis]|uniref:Uncharacterized protein n=1 Tax=Arthrobacter ginkgonis TaxID=1630594 RepID=A0ABP7CA16_9MICC
MVHLDVGGSGFLIEFHPKPHASPPSTPVGPSAGGAGRRNHQLMRVTLRDAGAAGVNRRRISP